MLEADGVFTLHLEGDWKVTGTPGQFYELTRSDRDGTLHISVYGRRPHPLTDAEARTLMTKFMDKLKPSEPVRIRVLPEGDDQYRAVAECSATDPASGSVFGWLVFLVLWKEHFLMCTCTASPGAPLLQEAEMLFASIAPAQSTRQGFLSRKRR